MPVSVTMPQLGESVTEGTVTRWLKQVGDTVTADEPLLEVSTDKVDTEIPAPASGVLLSIAAGEDATVDVGAELAVIGDSDEAPSAAAAPADAPADEAPSPTTPAAPEESGPQTSPAPAQAAAEQSAPAEESSTPAGATDGTPVLLPALGESVTEGTVTRWLKQVGDEVAADEPLVEVSTDKVDTEIPAPVGGVLLAINVETDATVEVGTALGVIGTPGAAPAGPSASGGSASANSTPAATAPTAATPAQAGPPESTPAPVPAAPPAAGAPPVPPAGSPPAPAPSAATAPSAESSTGSGLYVTPLVRKLAAEHDVDLAGLTGTGVGGRIRKQDVLDAAEAARQPAPAPAAGPASAAAPADAAPAATPTTAAPTPSAGASSSSTPSAGASSSSTPSALRGRTEKLTRLRKVIATRMVESLQTSAQLTTVAEVDVTRIALLRARTKDSFAAREGVKLSFLPFFARAALDALRTYPQVNATIDTNAGTVTYPDGEHLGVAVDTERGLLVPVIRDAGDLSIPGLARKIADLAERTRTNKVSPDELSGGTFTLTNTGSRGALFDTPIINQPQVAILGTGAVVKRAVVVTDDTGTDAIAIRSMVYLALTYDHRLVDGAGAARFLATVKARLETAAFEADLGV